MKIQIDKEKLEELISLNWRRKEIAEFFHVSDKTISERVKEYGLTFKKGAKQKEVHICERCGKEYIQSKYHPFCSKKCAEPPSKINTEVTTNLAKDIIELRNKGLSYREIVNALHCSKGTVSYYCDPEGRTKKKEYKKQYNPAIKKLSKCVAGFKSKKKRERVRFKCSDFCQSFKTRVSNFVGNWERYNKMKAEDNFGYKEVLDYIGGWETKCYLTGRSLDLRIDDYELDHILPISRGGSCKLTNLGVTCEQANRSKSNMTVEEYIQLCKEVLEHNGYKVEKK